MSDMTNAENDSENENVNGAENWRKRVERERDEAKALADAASTELATLKRDKAFDDAGLDLTDPAAAFFAENYKGDMTAEAVATKARELRLLAPAKETSTLQPEIDAIGRMNAASIGAQTIETPVGDLAKIQNLASIDDDAEFWAQAKALGVMRKS